MPLNDVRCIKNRIMRRQHSTTPHQINSCQIQSAHKNGHHVHQIRLCQID